MAEAPPEARDAPPPAAAARRASGASDAAAERSCRRRSGVSTSSRVRGKYSEFSSRKRRLSLPAAESERLACGERADADSRAAPRDDGTRKQKNISKQKNR